MYSRGPTSIQQKINTFYRTDVLCPRCQQPDADLLHMLWAGSSLHTYWHQVCAALTASTDRRTGVHMGGVHIAPLPLRQETKGHHPLP